MKISLNWLRDYLPDLKKDLDAKELRQTISLKLAEVDAAHDQKEAFSHIVVGQIKTLRKHPEADRLHLCDVSLGSDVQQIVCGGINLYEGQFVACALPGAKVRWHGEGDLVELKETKIRGEKSFGMICAADEIGLEHLAGADHEILDLKDFDPKKPGQDLSALMGLDDIILDIDNHSLTHRPDLWGHLGWAYELAAIYGLKMPTPPSLELKPTKGDYSVNIQAKEHCFRFSGTVIEGLQNGPSPDWVQTRLRAVGLRPINLLVDITNYVMLDTGQPMHAYDLKKLPSKELVVRMAKNKEKLVSLDDDTHVLTKEMLIAVDGLGGIMGGKTTMIEDTTSAIFLEAANWHPKTIRRTAIELGIHTDASARFQKTLQTESTSLAMNRATELLAQICPSMHIAQVIDEMPPKHKDLVISFYPKTIETYLGIEIPLKTMATILETLGFGVKTLKDHLDVTVPWWRRKDISNEMDLTEEVGRIHGYEHLEPELPSISIRKPVQDPLNVIERSMRQVLVGLGLDEVKSYPFVGEKMMELLLMNPDEHVGLIHPLSKEEAFLRRSLVPNTLKMTKENLKSFADFRLFEIERVFGNAVNKGRQHPDEQLRVCASVCSKSEKSVFHALKAVVQEAFNRLGYPVRFDTPKDLPDYLHSGRSVAVLSGKDHLGFMGELHPRVLHEMGVKARLALTELDLESLIGKDRKRVKYAEIIRFPSVKRDLALLCDERLEFTTLSSLIKKQDKRLIRDVRLFDVYQGKQIPEGKKSVAINILFQADDRTLEDKEVNQLFETIVHALGTHDITVRGA